MKLKIKIAGPKVHDVGYRVFLLKHAMNMALPGLSTYKWDEDGQQEVIALVKGDEARVKAFLKAIEKSKPEMAEVSKITSEPFDGEVGRTSEVAMFCSFAQLDKAIPSPLDMRDDLKVVRKNTDMIPQMSGDLKEMKGDIKEMKGDVKAVRKTADATFEEIKGQREDNQPGYGMSMQQVRADI
ncbi:MAG: acylphosphatase [Methanothrix sp.]|nr:acylphosphatase [Methanothrix sp.]